MERNTILKERLVLKKCIRRFISQSLLSIIILLVGLIIIKKNPVLKPDLKKRIYEDNLDFIKVKEIYDNYLGDIVPTKTIFKEEQAVFNEKLTYTKKEKYKDGVKLSVSDNYLVPAIQNGIVVFIGEKDGYGKTIIIEQTDGVDVFYSNIGEVKVSLYDYIDKGTLIGEANKSLVLLFQKEGKIIDYKDYI